MKPPEDTAMSETVNTTPLPEKYPSRFQPGDTVLCSGGICEVVGVEFDHEHPVMIMGGIHKGLKILYKVKDAQGNYHKVSSENVVPPAKRLN